MTGDGLPAPKTPGRPPGDGAPPTTWGLWVRGRLRTSVVLGDERGEHVAALSLHGWPRKRRRMKAETDEDDWTVTVEPGRLTVDRGDERRMTVEGDDAELAGHRFVWPAHDGGIHRGAFRDPVAGRVVVDVTPADGGDDAPVAVFAVAGDVPDTLAVVLAACAVQLITRPRGTMTDGVDPGAGFDIVSPF